MFIFKKLIDLTKKVFSITFNFIKVVFKKTVNWIENHPITSALLVVLFFVYIIAVAGFYNTVIERRDLLKNGVLDQSDSYYKKYHRALGLNKEGLNVTEPIFFVLPFEDGDIQDAVKNPEENSKTIFAFAKALLKAQKANVLIEDNLDRHAVRGLADEPNYHDDGQELHSDAFLSDDRVALLAESLDKQDLMGLTSFLRQFIVDVKKDGSVYGNLVGFNFDYIMTIMFSLRDGNEMDLFFNVKALFEEREIGQPIPGKSFLYNLAIQLEYYWSWDIYPTGDFEGMLIGGWPIGRSSIFNALNCAVVSLMIFSFLFSGIVAWVSLKSLKQSLIVITIIQLSFVWVRGQIGLMQTYGLYVHETVYILLIFSAMIVAGNSYAVHLLEEYNKFRKLGYLPIKAWMHAFKIIGVITVVSVIVCVSFLTLYFIGVRGIWEVGLLSATGIVFLLALVFLLMPALHILVDAFLAFTGLEKWQQGLQKRISIALIAKRDLLPDWLINVFGWVLDKLNYLKLDYLVTACYRMSQAMSPKTTFRSVYALCILAVFIIALDYLPVSANKGFEFLPVMSDPLEYITNTNTYRAAKFMNAPGRPGYDVLSIIVMPKDIPAYDEWEDNKSIYDVEFLGLAYEFEQDLKKLKNARHTTSVLDKIIVITQETYNKDFPKSDDEAVESFFLAEGALDYKEKEQYYYDNGITQYLSTDMENSNELGALCEDVYSLAQTPKYAQLDVIIGGKNPLYPRTDELIRVGKPINVLNSQWIVILFIALWVVFISRHNYAELYLHSLRTGWVMNIPFLFAAAVIALVMIIWRIPLDQPSACSMALGINAAMDFSVYIMAEINVGLKKGWSVQSAISGAMREKGRVVLIDVILNFVCFLPLTWAPFIPIQRLGWIMVVMIASCGFGSLVLMPAITPWCVRARSTQFRLLAFMKSVINITSKKIKLVFRKEEYIMRKFAYVLTAVLFLTVSQAQAQTSAREVMEKSWGLYTQNVQTEAKYVQLTIDDNGRKKKKELNHWVEYGTEEKIAINFLGNRRDQIKARIDRRDGQDRQWLKLPSWTKGKTVSIGDAKPFAGTSLIYEDLRQLENEALEDWDYSFVAGESKPGQWVIRAIPKAGIKSAYNQRTFTINKKYTVEKVVYAYANKRRTKVQTNDEIVYEDNGRWRVDSGKLEEPEINRITEIKVINRYINSPRFNKGVFNTAFLESKQKFPLLKEK